MSLKNLFLLAKTRVAQSLEPNLPCTMQVLLSDVFVLVCTFASLLMQNLLDCFSIKLLVDSVASNTAHTIDSSHFQA